MIVNQTVDMQIFDANDAKAIHDPTAFLMGEVVTPPFDTLMHTSDSFAVLVSLGCTLGKFGVLALDFGQYLLFLTKKRGLAISSPVERVANVKSPTSIPTCSSFSGKRSGSTSHEKQANHFPVEER